MPDLPLPPRRNRPAELASADYIGDLGDGLIRRWSTEADIEKIAWLLGSVFRNEKDELPNPRQVGEARLVLQPPFPYMTSDDAAVVEDTSQPSRPLVACTYFWRHRWSYGGIPFGVTQPEMVATDPAYRRRGLVRSLFEMIHARSAAEGHLLQAITGISHFYRQFGYEYALDLEGSRTTYFTLIPDKEDHEPERTSLRLATLDDVAPIRSMYDRRRSPSLVWHEASDDWWRYAIGAWDDPAVRGHDVTRVGVPGRYWMILDAEQEACGYAWVAARRRGPALSVTELNLVPGIDAQLLVPSLLRSLRGLGQGAPGVRADVPPCREISFVLGRDHPLYDLLGENLAPQVELPYAWYVRIPDVRAFLLHVASVLEARLAASILAGFSGDVMFDLYREGLKLGFDDGKLTAIEPWQASDSEDDDQVSALRCPPLIFLQLLLSYRSVDELRTIFPDVLVKDEARLLVDTLFPKQHSFVEPLGSFG